MTAAREAAVVRARAIDEAVARRIDAWRHTVGPVDAELQDLFHSEALNAWNAEFPILAAVAGDEQAVA